MRTALLVIHIASAAAWFGHKLPIPRDIRTSLRSAVLAVSLVERMRRTERLGVGSAVATILSGVGLLWLRDWTASVVLGLGIMAAIAAVALGALRARPAWAGLERAVANDDLETAAAFGRRFARSLHGENLLWMLALGAMVAG